MFYDKFKVLCEKRGLSCNKAAQTIGFSNSTVTKWKKGATPEGATVSRIAAFFGVSVGSLLDDEEQKKEPVPETISLRDERRLKAIELYNQLTPEGEEMALALLRTLVEQSGK